MLSERAHLPCDIVPMEPGDAVVMVFWFRDDQPEPFFSYDMRSRNLAKGRSWSSPTAFADRAIFRPQTHPAQLVIDGTQLGDEGLYRCRVDFLNSPTRNTRINLTVIGVKSILWCV